MIYKLQLPQETVVEKSGEFREALFKCKEDQIFYLAFPNGNPERSSDLKVRERAETRAKARTLKSKLGEAPDTLPLTNTEMVKR